MWFDIICATAIVCIIFQFVSIVRLRNRAERAETALARVETAIIASMAGMAE